MTLPDTSTLASVVYRFFHGLDTRDNDGVARLFARDGTWVRQGAPLTGPDAIRAALEQRDPARGTAHLITNLRIEHATPASARVRFYLTAYESRPGEDALHMHGIRDCLDELLLEDGEWRIGRKTSYRLLPKE
jgi:uncharacterized protein (TIGR02246 family)